MMKRERDSFSFCFNPRSITTDGLGHKLVKKWSSNSLENWSKDETEDSFSRLYHAQARLQRVVGNVWHIRALGVPYKPCEPRR